MFSSQTDYNMEFQIINEINGSLKTITQYRAQNPEKFMILVIAAIGILGTFYLFQYDAAGIGMTSLEQYPTLASK
jgi:hypothetical protein